MRFIYLLPFFFFFTFIQRRGGKKEKAFFSFSHWVLAHPAASPPAQVRLLHHLYSPENCISSLDSFLQIACTKTVLNTLKLWLLGWGVGCPQHPSCSVGATQVSLPWPGCWADLSSVHCRVSVYHYCVDIKLQPVPMDTADYRKRRAASLLYLHVCFHIP